MFLFQKSVERRPVVRIGVPDTIVTVDNRRAAMTTIVQIAGTENQTEPGSEARATFFAHSVFLLQENFAAAGGTLTGACPLLLAAVCFSLTFFSLFSLSTFSTHDHFRLLRPPAIPRPPRRATTRSTHGRSRHHSNRRQTQGRKDHHSSKRRNGEPNGTRR